MSDLFGSWNAPIAGTPQQGAVSSPFSAYTPPANNLHPIVQQAAQSPNAALTAQQIASLQGQLYPTATVAGQQPQLTPAQQQQQTQQTAAASGPASNSPQGGLFGLNPQYAQDPRFKGYDQALAKVGAAPGAKKGTPQQQQQQQLQDQWNQALGPMGVAGLTAGQVNGPAGQALAQKLAQIASKMTSSQATAAIGTLPKNLQTLVNGYIAQPPAAASSTSAASQPFSDPLALQTMWKDVFGPALQSSKSLLQNTGSDYVSAMNDVIAGSNLPPAEAAQQRAEARATGAMEQQLAGASYSSAVSKIPFDYITQALSTLTAQAELDRAAQERAITYGVAGIGSTGTTGTTGTTNQASINNALNALGIASSG